MSTRTTREIDYRVNAQMGFEVAVVRYGNWDRFGILVNQAPGIGMEAMLTRVQAERLARHLLDKLLRDRR